MKQNKIGLIGLICCALVVVLVIILSSRLTTIQEREQMAFDQVGCKDIIYENQMSFCLMDGVYIPVVYNDNDKQVYQVKDFSDITTARCQND